MRLGIELLGRGKIAGHAQAVVHQRGGLKLVNQPHKSSPVVLLLMISPSNQTTATGP